MNYTDYRKVKKLMDSFLETGNRKTQKNIQDMIEKKSGCREKILEDILESQEEYIKVFSTEDQIKIINNLVLLVETTECFTHNVTLILPYVSKKALKQILSTADDYALLKIIHEIKKNIKHSCNWDSKIKWCSIYIECRKKLNL